VDDHPVVPQDEAAPVAGFRGFGEEITAPVDGRAKPLTAHGAAHVDAEQRAAAVVVGDRLPMRPRRILRHADAVEDLLDP
jgi:hypothetical protein